ncbi:DUF4129 domain-containing protein [Pontibacter actiniarum]|uniref:Protein-glutamine gamma-glutamyltransferase-like C-terminal domain-containing protein n=1 Tax=Pontibacter actiniarum TaxID=323450 RepID=A0A1X9YRJ8_9BACT|nr:DUF4129 domain-containing protein [Pontibacter actiniarum]ARS35499.1 hypothetical protein CA264_08640 [Pontibacter actiniarum]
MRERIRHFFFTKLILCLLLSFGPAAHALAQDSTAVSLSPEVMRRFDQAKLEELRANEDFEYYEEARPANTFWERLKRRLQQWLEEVFYRGSASGLWQVLIYLAIAAAIVYLVVKMQHVDIGSLFGRKTASIATPYEVLDENIHEMDMVALLEEAVAQQNYRKAVRLLYLQSLKQLTDLGLINWQPGKTNRSYIAEIKPAAIRQEFEQLTGMFEYVWYGGAGLGQEFFASAQAEFQQFDARVKQHA